MKPTFEQIFKDELILFDELVHADFMYGDMRVWQLLVITISRIYLLGYSSYCESWKGHDTMHFKIHIIVVSF